MLCHSVALAALAVCLGAFGTGQGQGTRPRADAPPNNRSNPESRPDGRRPGARRAAARPQAARGAAAQAAPVGGRRGAVGHAPQPAAGGGRRAAPLGRGIARRRRRQHFGDPCPPLVAPRGAARRADVGRPRVADVAGRPPRRLHRRRGGVLPASQPRARSNPRLGCRRRPAQARQHLHAAAGAGGRRGQGAAHLADLGAAVVDAVQAVGTGQMARRRRGVGGLEHGQGVGRGLEGLRGSGAGQDGRRGRQGLQALVAVHDHAAAEAAVRIVVGHAHLGTGHSPARRHHRAGHRHCSHRGRRQADPRCRPGGPGVRCPGRAVRDLRGHVVLDLVDHLADNQPDGDAHKDEDADHHRHHHADHDDDNPAPAGRLGSPALDGPPRPRQRRQPLRGTRNVCAHLRRRSDGLDQHPVGPAGAGGRDCDLLHQRPQLRRHPDAALHVHGGPHDLRGPRCRQPHLGPPHPPGAKRGRHTVADEQPRQRDVLPVRLPPALHAAPLGPVRRLGPPRARRAGLPRHGPLDRGPGGLVHPAGPRGHLPAVRRHHAGLRPRAGRHHPAAARRARVDGADAGEEGGQACQGQRVEVRDDGCVLGAVGAGVPREAGKGLLRSMSTMFRFM